ncbi:MAG TPA: 16S rRNA (adenine(1518)-N(6)/adenine(1519)-N(6))-dimethyltransferase RsmA [Bacteroidales bacterium]|nr:16S rRNA (adenine(1518)-N(6)/adenine(1519)-N(6))-dimethyltransferase RsmA [Bacteroidales bacterium]HPS16178.1 16S rRNA (adenine(1518)-N(6)/adenine(1519)-N(6))-dimethyltransferase RsmA [Bacteroidales bacterium]
MYPVRAKKHLGQHFLKDENIAQKIVESLSLNKNVLEIGAGTGVLTKYLKSIPGIDLRIIEIDNESVTYLKNNFPEINNKVIQADFLRYNLKTLFDGHFSIIGNFPYNISSQILFRTIENRDDVDEVVGMFQKEVAVRIASAPGNKDYGILSVLLKAWYDIEYLFTVNENVFVPPPKVKSAVIRLKRNNVKELECDEKLFISVVKTAFNQRRKTLRNALSSFGYKDTSDIIWTKRAERLSVEDFVWLTRKLSDNY